MPPAVLPEHGPTLPEILGGRRPRRRGVLAAVAVAAAVGAAWAALASPAEEHLVVRTSPLAFNFRHGDELRRVAPRPPETIRLERRRGRRLVHAFAIAPLELPPYRGLAIGILPAFASSEAQRLAAGYEDFRLHEEGKASINGVPGYELVFSGRRGGQDLYGRLVLVPEPSDGTRRGVRLLLESWDRTLPRPQRVGGRGISKLPYRSFRFGTEPA